MATPHVTGVVGLLLSVNPNLTVDQIRNAILNTGNASPLLNGVVSTGRRLNALNALNSISHVYRDGRQERHGKRNGRVEPSRDQLRGRL